MFVPCTDSPSRLPINNKGANCKVPKFLDTRKFCCNLPKIQTKRSSLRVFNQKDTNGIVNSEDPDQTALPAGGAV